MSEDIRYQPVTVDVPSDRVAEFHQLFGLFLAGSLRRGRGRRHQGRHGHRCHGHQPAPETRSEAAEA